MMFKTTNLSFFPAAPIHEAAASSFSAAEIECLDVYWDIYVKTLMERSFFSSNKTEQKNKLISFWEQLIQLDETELIKILPTLFKNQLIQ